MRRLSHHYPWRKAPQLETNISQTEVTRLVDSTIVKMYPQPQSFILSTANGALSVPPPENAQLPSNNLKKKTPSLADLLKVFLSTSKLHTNVGLFFLFSFCKPSLPCCEP